jgi:hypothetical protein
MPKRMGKGARLKQRDPKRKVRKRRSTSILTGPEGRRVSPPVSIKKSPLLNRKKQK